MKIEDQVLCKQKMSNVKYLIHDDVKCKKDFSVNSAVATIQAYLLNTNFCAAAK